MKTTVDIADQLLCEAKDEAARRGTTLRSLIEAGLVEILGEPRQSERFTLRSASVGGMGADAWQRMTDQERLELAYGDRA